MYARLINSRLVRKGLFAFVIKIATAGLSFGMFVLLARWLSPEDYGFYAQCFNLGTFFSLLALAGVHMLILRQLPIYSSISDKGAAVALIRDGYIVVFSTAIVLCVLTMLIGLFGKLVGVTYWAPFFAVVLALPLALSEYQCNVLRGWGFVKLALLPRDIMWRVLVVAVVGWVFVSCERLDVLVALFITGFILAMLVAIQFILGFRASSLSGVDVALKSAQPRPFKVLQQSRWLAGATIAGALLPLLSVVGVGLVLDSEAAGVFFAAQRTSMLLSLPLVAANIIGAPIIANAWAIGGRSRVQEICSNIVLGVLLPTVAGLIFFIFKGELLMSLFNSEYAEYKTILIISSFGALINAFCGSVGFLLQMTNQEKAFVVILVITQSIGLFMVIIGAFIYGLLGAAIADALGLALWNICAAVWARKALGVDPTIFFFVRKPANQRATISCI